MFSKLNCYKLQINPNPTKDTKLQKYLRERNKKILEKCFNIKIEKPTVKTEDHLKEVQKSNNEKLPQQPSNQESCMSKTTDSFQITSNTKEIDLPKTFHKKEETEAEKLAKSQSSPKAMEFKKSPPSLTTSQITERPKSAFTQNFNRSSNNRGSKAIAAGSSTSSNWKSPFKSFITTGKQTRLTNSHRQSSDFAYDLSRDELKFDGQFRRPMKPAPEAERQLLNNGQRREYLMQRYEHSPVEKYNYPEATSWRIGWLQQQ